MRRDDTKPDADGDEGTLSRSPSGEPRKAPKREPQKPKPSPTPETAGPGRRTRLVLLPVDPHVIHAYWRLAPQDLEKAFSQLREFGQQAPAVLKFYDVTHTKSDGTNAGSSFEINVELAAGNWYVHLWSPGRSYCADLGFRTVSGGFLPVARSNIAATPPATPSTRVEDHVTVVKDEPRHIEENPPPTEPKNAPLFRAWRKVETPSEYSKEAVVETGHEQGKSAFSVRPAAKTEGEAAGSGSQPQPSSVPPGIARLVDWSRVWLDRLAEMYRRRFWPELPSRPAQPTIDLAEASEKKFASGLSSPRGPESGELKK